MYVAKRSQAGFTLVELAVVIVIIGILAAFGVPRFMNSVERSKASEAFNYLQTVVSAQERYHARQGKYASSLTQLDVGMEAPEYFKVGSVSAGDTKSIETSWKLTLTRTGASSGYGNYTVTYTQAGFDKDAKQSSIVKLTAINPMGS